MEWLQFSNTCHGQNVLISTDQLTAQRSLEHIGQAYVCSQEPLTVNRIFSLEVECNHYFCGNLRVGLTNKDPITWFSASTLAQQQASASTRRNKSNTSLTAAQQQILAQVCLPGLLMPSSPEGTVYLDEQCGVTAENGNVGGSISNKIMCWMRDMPLPPYPLSLSTQNSEGILTNRLLLQMLLNSNHELHYYLHNHYGGCLLRKFSSPSLSADPPKYWLVMELFGTAQRVTLINRDDASCWEQLSSQLHESRDYYRQLHSQQPQQSRPMFESKLVLFTCNNKNSKDKSMNSDSLMHQAWQLVLQSGSYPSSIYSSMVIQDGVWKNTNVEEQAEASMVIENEDNAYFANDEGSFMDLQIDTNLRYEAEVFANEYILRHSSSVLGNSFSSGGSTQTKPTVSRIKKLRFGSSKTRSDSNNCDNVVVQSATAAQDVGKEGEKSKISVSQKVDEEKLIEEYLAKEVEKITKYVEKNFSKDMPLQGAIKALLIRSKRNHFILSLRAKLQQQQSLDVTPLSSPIHVTVWNVDATLPMKSPSSLCLLENFLPQRAIYICLVNLNEPVVLEEDIGDASTTQKATRNESPLMQLHRYLSILHLKHGRERSPLEMKYDGAAPSVPPQSEPDEDSMKVNLTDYLPAVVLVAVYDEEQLCSDKVDVRFKELWQFVERQPYRYHILKRRFLLSFDSDSPNKTEYLDTTQVNTATLIRNHLSNLIQHEPYMGEVIPVSWMFLRHKLTSLSSEQRILLLSQLQNIISSDERLRSGFSRPLRDYESSEYARSRVLDENNILLACHWLHQQTFLLFSQWFLRGRDAANYPMWYKNSTDFIVTRPMRCLRFLSALVRRVKNLQSQSDHAMKLHEDMKAYSRGVLCHHELELISIDKNEPTLSSSVSMQLLEMFHQAVPASEPLQPVEFSQSIQTKIYYPCLFTRPFSYMDNHVTDWSFNCIRSSEVVCFYIVLSPSITRCVYHRLVCQLINWCREKLQRSPLSYSSQYVEIMVDAEHDVLLKCSDDSSVINVSLKRAKLEDFEEDSGSKDAPDSRVCAKIRNFLESELERLRAVHYRRLSWNVMVACTCRRQCKLHFMEACSDPQCIHYLKLDECLRSRVVLCGHRRVKTSLWQMWFGADETFDNQLHRKNAVHEIAHLKDVEGILPLHVLGPDVWNIEVQKGKYIPIWMKALAKLLNDVSPRSPNHNSPSKYGEQNGNHSIEGEIENVPPAAPISSWKVLGQHLGYTDCELQRFKDDMNPSLFMLVNWVITNGNTNVALDMLIAVLHSMERSDLVDIVESSVAPDDPCHPIFLSYQWDSLAHVLLLRDRFERAGFTCWMDVGQLGSGDLLYASIEKGIRRCQLFLACVTVKYTFSPLCQRELILADNLRKPILPIRMDRNFGSVSWPPPCIGGMGLILAPRVYVDFSGVGQHGGNGMRMDMEEKYAEVIKQAQRYAKPNFVSKASRLGDGSKHGNNSDYPNQSVLPSTSTNLSGRHPAIGAASRRLSSITSIPSLGETAVITSAQQGSAHLSLNRQVAVASTIQQQRSPSTVPAAATHSARGATHEIHYQGGRGNAISSMHLNNGTGGSHSVQTVDVQKCAVCHIL